MKNLITILCLCLFWVSCRSTGSQILSGYWKIKDTIHIENQNIDFDIQFIDNNDSYTENTGIIKLDFFKILLQLSPTFQSRGDSSINILNYNSEKIPFNFGWREKYNLSEEFDETLSHMYLRLRFKDIDHLFFDIKYFNGVDELGLYRVGHDVHGSQLGEPLIVLERIKNKSKN